MQSITQPTPYGTFGIYAQLGLTHDHIDGLGGENAQHAPFAAINLGDALAPPMAPAMAPNASAIVASSGEDLRHDSMPAIAFLKMLDPNGVHNLWAKHPE